MLHSVNNLFSITKSEFQSMITEFLQKQGFHVAWQEMKFEFIISVDDIGSVMPEKSVLTVSCKGEVSGERSKISESKVYGITGGGTRVFDPATGQDLGPSD